MRYMAPYKWRYFIGLLFLFLTGLVFLMITQLMRYLVDSGEGEEVFYQIPFDLNLKTIGITFIIVLLAQAFFSFFRVYLFAYVTERSLADFRKDAFNRLITLPMTFFSEKSVGELNSRMASDISQIQEVLNTTVAEFLRQAMIIIGGVAMLFVVSPKLTLTMLAIVPIMAIAAVFFGRFIRKLSKEAQDHIAQSTNIVEEAVTGIQNVKAFTNELYESVRFGKSVDEIRRVSLKSGIYRGAFASFIIICIFGAIMGILWYAMYMVQQGLITQGMMVQFMVLALTIGISIGGMAELYASLQKGIGATERVFEIIDEMAEPVTIQDNSSRIKLRGSIEFRHIDFTYPSRPELPVLRDVSFTANPGEQVAIVGPSGAGKSTITSILLQFYKQSGGELLIDGKPASQYELTELRKHMAIVPQEVTLFGGTIKENIAYGMPNATLEEIQEAADLANASEFIHRFPEGFETKVGERGVQLSGGQRQRVAIARAVLNNPTILILDEATSSLDSESERLVQEALENLMKGRTSVVIAHRLSTIKKADKILVLEHGHLREQGTHEELVAIEDGLYKHLSKLQFQV